MSSLESVQRYARVGGPLVALAGVVTIGNSFVEAGAPHAALIETIGEYELVVGIVVALLGNIRAGQSSFVPVAPTA